MELRQLRYFVRIVELGSMGRAAIDLDMVQSALSQQISRLQCPPHHDGKCSDGNIGATTRNICFANRHQPIIIFWHVKALPIHHFIFEKNYRIGITDRRFQQPLGISRRIGRYNL